MTLTIRQYQEAIVALTAGPLDRATRDGIRWHAVAALKALDEAALDILKSTDAHGNASLANAYASVPDPWRGRRTDPAPPTENT